MPAAPRPEPKIPPDTAKSLAGGGGGVPKLKTSVIKNSILLNSNFPKRDILYTLTPILKIEKQAQRFLPEILQLKRNRKETQSPVPLALISQTSLSARIKGGCCSTYRFLDTTPEWLNSKLPGKKPGNMFNKHPRWFLASKSGDLNAYIKLNLEETNFLIKQGNWNTARIWPITPFPQNDNLPPAIYCLHFKVKSTSIINWNWRRPLIKVFDSHHTQEPFPQRACL